MKHLKLILLIFFSLVFISTASSDENSQQDSVDNESNAAKDEPMTTLKPDESRTSKRKKNFLNILNFFKKKSANGTESKNMRKQRHKVVTKSIESIESADSIDSADDSAKCPLGCKYCRGGKCKLNKCKHCRHHR